MNTVSGMLLNNLLKYKKNMHLIFMSMCVGTCMGLQISKYFCLCKLKHMASLTLNLKAIMHAGKCEGTGCKSGEPWLSG